MHESGQISNILDGIVPPGGDKLKRNSGVVQDKKSWD